MIARRKRDRHLHVMVTADVLEQIQKRMAEAGITNAGAYMRKMALNGYILHVDLAPVRELVSLRRRCSNNLNQVAVHAHTYGVYPEEIEGLKQDYSRMWEMVSAVLGGGFPLSWRNDWRGAACVVCTFPFFLPRANLARRYNFS